MRPFVKDFKCGHAVTVKSWRATERVEKCSGCEDLEDWMTSSGLYEHDTPELGLVGKIREAMFDYRFVKPGGYRKPEIAAREILGKPEHREFLTMWLIMGGDRRGFPSWVRDFLEGRKTVKPKSTHAAAAAAAKAAILKEFPRVKIRAARSSSFANGSSIGIYLDGYIHDEDWERIQEIVKQFEYGHFDGMNDIYVYSNSRDDIPQVKFASVYREE
jgi:hypothetical protein